MGMEREEDGNREGGRTRVRLSCDAKGRMQRRMSVAKGRSLKGFKQRGDIIIRIWLVAFMGFHHTDSCVEEKTVMGDSSLSSKKKKKY